MGPGLGAKISVTRRAYASEYSLIPRPSGPCAQSEPHPAPTCSGVPLRQAGRSGSGSYEITDFALASSAHETLCVSCKSGVSVHPSPMELLQSSLISLQNQMLWGLHSISDLQVGEPDIRLRTLTLIRECLQYILQFAC